jgi:hypothetical protein
VKNLNNDGQVIEVSPLAIFHIKATAPY